MVKRVKRRKTSESSKPEKKKQIKKTAKEKIQKKKIRYEVPEEQSKINEELNTMIKSLEKSNYLLLEKLVKIEDMLDNSTINTEKKVKEIKNNWNFFQNEMENLQKNVLKKSKEVFLENIKNEIKSKFDNLENFVKENLEKNNANRKRGRPRRKKIENLEKRISEKKINKTPKKKKIENKVESLKEIKDYNTDKNNLITFGNIKKNTYNIGSNKNIENNKNIEDSIINKKSIDRIDNIEEVMKLRPDKSIVLKQKNSALLLNNDSFEDKDDGIDHGAFYLSD